MADEEAEAMEEGRAGPLDLDRVLRAASTSHNRGRRNNTAKITTQTTPQVHVNGISKGKDKGKDKVQENEKETMPRRGETVFIHQVTSSDTLEGLAVRYGVQVAELKRLNKLWTKADIFAKKELIIPYQQDEKTPHEELLAIFMRELQCEEKIAKKCLQRTNFQLAPAIALYRDESVKRKVKQRKLLEENGHPYNRSTPALSFITPPEVEDTDEYGHVVHYREVAKTIKEKMEKEEEQIFDL